jgi:hypothetical protein
MREHPQRCYCRGAVCTRRIAAPPMLTHAYVRKLFNYDPLSGVLTWRVRIAQRTYAGDQAGSDYPSNRRVKIRGVKYPETKIIWLWMTGVWPDEVDHRDCNFRNNRWRNLRLATRSENVANRRKYIGNKLKWVTITPKGRYQSHVQFNRVSYHVGTYDTEQEAHNAAYAMAQQLHGAFVRS